MAPKNSNSQKKLFNLFWLIPIILAITCLLLTAKIKLPWLIFKRTQGQYITIIESLLNSGNFSQAYNEALDYEKSFPKSSDSAYYLGEALFQMGKYRESVIRFQQALEDNQLSDQRKSNIYYLIGRNYDYLHDRASAISHLQTAIEINPSNFSAYDALALEYIKVMKYANAIGILKQELSLIPDSNDNPLATYAYYSLAKIYFIITDYTEARVNIETAKKLSKGLTQPQSTLLLQQINDLESEINKMKK